MAYAETRLFVERGGAPCVKLTTQAQLRANHEYYGRIAATQFAAGIPLAVEPERYSRDPLASSKLWIPQNGVRNTNPKD